MSYSEGAAKHWHSIFIFVGYQPSCLGTASSPAQKYAYSYPVSILHAFTLAHPANTFLYHGPHRSCQEMLSCIEDQNALRSAL